MRARRTINVPTAAKLAVGASVLAFPATAVAVTADGNATTVAPTPVALHDVHTVKTAYGVGTIVRGSAPAADAGTRLELEYRPNDARRWRTVDRGRIRRDGHFELTAHIGRSGALRVLPAPAARSSRVPSDTKAGTAATGTAATGTAATTTTATSAPAARTAGLIASPVSHIVVAPKLTVSRNQSVAIVGETDQITGHLLPGIADRKVELQVHRDGRWVGVASARTRHGGAFDVRYLTPAVSREETRVAFAGDHFNTRADSNVESISGMAYAEVSWYYDAGDTACGFHATYGIASRTLPCGTKVTLSYGGRTVTATVDDRGPFVYSRLYDLNQTVAAALGMNGVAEVLASV